MFDQYEVDLVLCGHEHHYERSHPLRGAMDTQTRTPIPVDTRGDVIDATRERCTWSSVAGAVADQQPVVLPRTPLPGRDRGRPIRSRRAVPAIDLRARGRTMVGVP
ncbi:hypothetical protein I551_9123 [Mycobacterium ulcerans str. Harvey]|uniref:Calcineurin-like phosphoesterase family protein n=1 Tax=Mycobacterium ulcerans str. Harvey TaxID=1299332 RepID=A0ABN0R8R9_MYCUL|nr:hypothetical protein I551_9123 [Mycobacterium ulcerans str. Harvey]